MQYPPLAIRGDDLLDMLTAQAQIDNSLETIKEVFGDDPKQWSGPFRWWVVSWPNSKNRSFDSKALYRYVGNETQARALAAKEQDNV